jgi:hypothetical protein
VEAFVLFELLGLDSFVLLRQNFHGSIVRALQSCVKEKAPEIGPVSSGNKLARIGGWVLWD